MRNFGCVALAIAAVGLAGCSQVSNVFKKKPHYHLDDGTAVYLDSEANLRTAPQQPYQFADQSYDVEIYNSSSQMPTYSPYVGYDVELYGAEQSFASAAYTDPRNAEFVMLNGDSEILDWQNCEMINRGYLFMSEQDFRLNPDFEVCMRNKGYVLSTEYGPSYKEGVSAQAARLRGAMPPTYSSYSYP